MISHKLNEIAEIADSITIIRDGRTIESLDVTAGDVDEDRIIRGMVGRALESRFPEHTSTIGEKFFEVRDWTIEHPQVSGRLVCKHSNFYVRRGEIVGFAGLMGAGRTELARSIFGRTYGTYLGGQILMDGEEITVPSVASAIAHGIAYVPEDRKTLGLNLLDNVKDTVVSAGIKRIAKRTVIDPDAEVQAAEEYRKAMNIKAASIRVGVSTLSGGNQQKVVLAKWMFTQPSLAILDEPTRGIDVGAKYEVYKIINRLAESGAAVLMISSEIEELIGMCDRIVVMSHGEISGRFDRQAFDREAILRSAMWDNVKTGAAA